MMSSYGDAKNSYQYRQIDTISHGKVGFPLLKVTKASSATVKMVRGTFFCRILCSDFCIVAFCYPHNHPSGSSYRNFSHGVTDGWRTALSILIHIFLEGTEVWKSQNSLGKSQKIQFHRPGGNPSEETCGGEELISTVPCGDKDEERSKVFLGEVRDTTKAFPGSCCVVTPIKHGGKLGVSIEACLGVWLFVVALQLLQVWNFSGPSKVTPRVWTALSCKVLFVCAFQAAQKALVPSSTYKAHSPTF